MIRAATIEDCTALAALYATGFEQPWTAEDFQSFLHESATGLLMEENGHIRAFLLSRVLIDEAEILTLVTDPEYQRNGLASRLIEEQINTCRRQQVVTLFLEVREDNPAARNLYARMGFEIMGRRKDYYIRADGSRCDAITMLKFL